MRVFQVQLTMRYTRVSCMPFRARLEIDRPVQAADREDALRQACLCLDQELEEILARVNSFNITVVRVVPGEIVERGPAQEQDVWNPEPFPPDIPIPRYLELEE